MNKYNALQRYCCISLTSKLIKIVKKLRAPDGCDWDREQTHESLIPYLLEETHEVIESIENKDNSSNRSAKKKK